MLRYGVLGLLIERRGYGYELVQRLSARLGSVWQLNASAVYTALDQLQDGGLIEALPGPPAAGVVSRRCARLVYRPTERGVAEFRRWLASPSRRVEPVHSELALKVAFASARGAPSLLAVIAHEEQLIVQALRQEQEAVGGASTRLRVVGEGGPQSRAPVAATLLSAAATMRLQAELDWLAVVREVLQRMLAEAGGAAVAGGETGGEIGGAGVAGGQAGGAHGALGRLSLG